MNRFRRAGLLAIGATLLCSSYASASHEQESFDIPGVYGNESAYIGVIDALPSGSEPNFNPRTVWLDFTLELLGDWHGNAPGLETPFEVYAGEDLLLRTTFSTFPDVPQAYPGTFPIDNFVNGGPRSYDLRLGFPLVAQEPSTDLVVEFRRSGTDLSGTWSLSNVTLDWSRPLSDPIPEPSSILQVSRQLSWRSGGGGATPLTPFENSSSWHESGTGP